MRFLIAIFLLVIGAALAAPAPERPAGYEYTVRAGTHEPEASLPDEFVATEPGEVPVDLPAIEALPADPELLLAEDIVRAITIPVAFIDEQAPDQIRASELIGLPVFGTDGSHVADIVDLLVDGDNHVSAVVLSSGGVLGFGDRRVAVPRYSLIISGTDRERRASIPFDAADLAAAPEFQPRERDGRLSRAGNQADRPLFGS